MTYRNSDLVHEGYELNGQLGKLNNAIAQIPYGDLSEAIRKMDRYTTLNARQHLARSSKSSFFKAISHSAWAFFKSYILQRGFLDGPAGFVVAFLRFENSFYKHLKLLEARNAEQRASSRPVVVNLPTAGLKNLVALAGKT